MSDEDLSIIPDSDDILADVRSLIEQSRSQLSQIANAALTTLYWRIGKRVQSEILQNRRAEYGKEIVASLGRQLATEFGAGFGEKNLRRMVQFAEIFPDEQIVAAHHISAPTGFPTAAQGIALGCIPLPGHSPERAA